MSNLTKPLKVEELSGGGYSLDRRRRAGKLAKMAAETMADKCILHQLKDNNTGRDFLEEMLLKINSISVEEGENVNKFNTEKKSEMQKLLRAALNHNYGQKVFLKLVRENGYEAAEEFKTLNQDNNAIDENMKKKVKEMRKKYN